MLVQVLVNYHLNKKKRENNKLRTGSVVQWDEMLLYRQDKWKPKMTTAICSIVCGSQKYK